MKLEELPDIPGHLFKDVCWQNDSKTLIGKYSPFICPHGKMVVKWISYDKEKQEATLFVHSGSDKYKGKTAVSKVIPALKFTAGTENLLPFFLSL